MKWGREIRWVLRCDMTRGDPDMGSNLKVLDGLK